MINLIFGILFLSTFSKCENDTLDNAIFIRQKSLYPLNSPNEDGVLTKSLISPSIGTFKFNGRVEKVLSLNDTKNEANNTKIATLKSPKSPRKGNLEREEVTVRNTLYDPFGSNNDVVSIYQDRFSPAADPDRPNYNPNYNPYNPKEGRADDLEAFTARRANRFSTIFGSKIIFQETVDQVSRFVNHIHIKTNLLLSSHVGHRYNYRQLRKKLS